MYFIKQLKKNYLTNSSLIFLLPGHYGRNFMFQNIYSKPISWLSFSTLVESDLNKSEENKFQDGSGFTPLGWKKRKVAVVAGYVGTGYSGCQFNGEDIPTIERELRNALFRVGCIRPSNMKDLSKVSWSRSSRTDKNVHASNVIISAKLLVPLDQIEKESGRISNLVDDINHYLPSSIRVFSISQVRGSFQARQTCLSREYDYILPVSILRNCLMKINPNMTSIDVSQAIQIYNSTVQKYQGVHNFHNFTKIKRIADKKVLKEKQDGNSNNLSEKKRPRISQHFRTIYKCSNSEVIELNGEPVIITTLKGSSFALHQIRLMIGAAIARSCGILSENVFTAALKTAFMFNLPMAPPEGLLLKRCSFTHDIRPCASAFDEDFYGQEITLEKNLLNDNDKKKMIQFEHDTIHPEILKAWKDEHPTIWVDKLDQWVDILKSHEEVAEEALQEMGHYLQLKEEKQKMVVDIRREKLDDYHNFKCLLPVAFSTSLTIHFQMTPGRHLVDVQRALAKDMHDGKVPLDVDTNSLLEYVQSKGIDILAKEGQILRKESCSGGMYVSRG